MSYINNRTKLENHEKFLINTLFSQIESSFILRSWMKKKCFLSNKTSKARSTIGRKGTTNEMVLIHQLMEPCYTFAVFATSKEVAI